MSAEVKPHLAAGVATDAVDQPRAEAPGVHPFDEVLQIPASGTEP
ncbi:hypothetical protein [Micromonospora sp. NPDC023814]